MPYSIKENEPLAAHTVFKIGGPARFFAEVDNSDDFVGAIKAACGLGLPWLVLGAGSNVLVSDRGFAGMVVHWRRGMTSMGGNRISAEAPVPMAKIVAESLQAGLVGFEWAIGVPGTIGGSVRGNAGCFGCEMKDVVAAVRVFDASSLTLEDWASARMEFGYRHSIFKRRPELVIISAVIALKAGDAVRGERLVREYTTHRAKTQNIGSQSAGCMFKNVLWAELGAEKDDFLRRFPEFSQFKGLAAIPSGFLIEKAGLKGKTAGMVKISERHGNFFLNLGGARAEDVLRLITMVKENVKNKYGLGLEEEVQFVGFDDFITKRGLQAKREAL